MSAKRKPQVKSAKKPAKKATKPATLAVVTDKKASDAVEALREKINKMEVFGRNYIEEPTFSTKPRDGERSGVFIARMLETNSLTTAEIAALVRAQYSGSKASIASVAFIRRAIKYKGTPTLVVRIDKQGRRYAGKE